MNILEEVIARGESTVPATPTTRAVNAVPVQFDPTVPNADPARMLEVLCQKHEALKHLIVAKVGPAHDVRDPGFDAMRSVGEVVNAIVAVFARAGYRVTIQTDDAIVAAGLPKLIAAGQAVYDLMLRHQSMSAARGRRSMGCRRISTRRTD